MKSPAKTSATLSGVSGSEITGEVTGGTWGIEVDGCVVSTGHCDGLGFTGHGGVDVGGRLRRSSRGRRKHAAKHLEYSKGPLKGDKYDRSSLCDSLAHQTLLITATPDHDLAGIGLLRRSNTASDQNGVRAARSNLIGSAPYSFDLSPNASFSASIPRESSGPHHETRPSGYLRPRPKWAFGLDPW